MTVSAGKEASKALLGAIGPADTTGTYGLDTICLKPDGKTYAYSFQRRLSTLFVVTGLR